jgi:LacI family transcriptional regulator
MNKKLRIKDIAQIAGVSSGTVDRVIHNRGQVTEENRQNILRIIEEQRYQPNLLARTLANKKKYLLVSLCPEYATLNDYWKAPDSGIDRAAKEISDYNIIVKRFFFDQFSVNSYKDKLAEIIAVKPDGVLLSPVFTDETVYFVKQLDENQVPYVFIDSTIDHLNNISYLGQNSYQSGFLAARLLSNITPVTSSIIIVRSGGAKPSNQSTRREEGIRDYFEKNAKLFHLQHFELIAHDHKNLIQFKNELKETQARGIIVINSKAFEVATALMQTGSNEVKVIGYDLLPENIRLLKEGHISFLLAQRPEEQGYKGIMTLFNHLVMKLKMDKENYLPIDILTRENIDYYLKYL